MRRGEIKSRGWQDVEEGSRRGEGLDPVGRRHGGLKQQGANDIIYGANNTFSFTVLRQGIRAGHVKMNALGEKEGTGTGVIELFPVVTLNRLDAGAKLSGGVGDEIGERAESVRLKAERKSLQVVSAIIKNDQIIFKTRDANDRRHPQITMNKVKLMSSPRS